MENSHAALTEEQINDAIDQMISHCRLSMEQFKAGVGEYAVVSARSVLNELGFSDDAEQILQAISDRGFDYCLDSEIVGRDDGKPPHRDACYWGADQLESRLHWVVRR